MDILITGGAGFIGCNLAAASLAAGDKVTIIDNLSRPRTDQNLRWLQSHANANQLTFFDDDIRDHAAMQRLIPGHDVVYHLAAQVAVTTSVTDPREDFAINALGTFNVLEAARLASSKPIIVYASTNKVYGGMEEITINEGPSRYSYADFPEGIPETAQLDFHSPYGCSKGAADQYVRDYERIYDIPSVVFRQSCIYGPRQFGVEDQGWAAHFVIAAVFGRPISIFGNGKQVRDMLYIDDLVRAYRGVIGQIDTVRGQIYNIGGGASNTLAIWSEFGPLLEKLVGEKVTVNYGEWRPGDQPVYVSDISKARKELGWHPQVSVEDGIGRLVEWVRSHKSLFE